MPVGKQDHSGIPVAVAVVTGCLHQPFDLLLGEILPHPVMRIGQPTASNCSLFGGWRGRARGGIHWPTPINQSITSPIMFILGTVYNRLVAAQWSMSSGIRDLRTAQPGMQRAWAA